MSTELNYILDLDECGAYDNISVIVLLNLTNQPKQPAVQGEISQLAVPG